MEGKEGATRVWDCGIPLYDSSELASLSHIIDRHTMALPDSENSANQKKMVQMVVWADVAETEKKKTKTTNAVSKIRKGLGEVFDCISFRRRPQQRVFGMQVFELHRLIKVQKLIAASPQLLLEGNTYLNKPSNIKLPQCNTNSQPVELRGQDDIHKAKHNLEQPIDDDIAGIPALSAYEDGSEMSTQVRVSKVGQNSVIPSSLPMAPDDKQSPWSFPPLSNQWLVPVMSPSEGLVYKPYSRPCPSPGGFMAPLYGGCTPLVLSPLPVDFVNPAYGVPASHQPPNMGLSGPRAIPPHYYPIPYNFRPVKPIISSSAVEQVSNPAGSQADGQTVQYSRGSCNMFHPPRDKVFFSNLGKFQVSKNSELQGSTASSPTEAARPEGRLQIPLLPTSPVANSLNCPSQSSGRDSQTRVIKVVPHNARSATESAARIFQSIQQERQQHDS